MAYDRQFLRLDFLFSVAASDEVAVTSLNYAAPTGWTGAVAALDELTEDSIEDCLALMDDLLSNSNLFWGNYSTLIGGKIAAVGTDGHYLAAPLIREATGTYVGGSTTTLPQSTVVASLRTGFTFGAARFGRQYLPHTRLGLVSGTAQSNVATTDIVVVAYQTFLNGVTAVLQDLVTAVITPMVMTEKVGAASRAVTSVAIGTVTDTQRRRRNKLVETYSTAPLA